MINLKEKNLRERIEIINEDIIVGEANGNIIYLKHCNLLAPKFIATFSKLLLIFFKIL